MTKYIFILFMILNSCNYSHKHPTSNWEALGVKDLETLADEYYMLENFNEAKSLYKLIIEKDSTKAEAFLRRAYCRTQTDDFIGAISDLHCALELGYKLDITLYNLACNYAAIGQDSLALIYFSNILQLYPSDESVKDQIKLIKSKNRF